MLKQLRYFVPFTRSRAAERRGVYRSPRGDSKVCSTQRASKRNQGFAVRRTGKVQFGQRAALYCRVSTADQSCAGQERTSPHLPTVPATRWLASSRKPGQAFGSTEQNDARSCHSHRPRRSAGDRTLTTGTQYHGPAGDIEGTGGVAGVGRCVERNDVRSRVIVESVPKPTLSGKYQLFSWSGSPR
jgi:hypothetical protein